MKTRVTIISVCLNNEKVLPLFLDQMQKWSYTDFHYILVDNGSRDHSVEMVRSRIGNASIIELGQNLGTTGGFNRGFEETRRWGAEYVMWLSPDVLLAPDCLGLLVDELDRQPKVGAVGPVLFKSHDLSLVESAGFTVDRRDWSIYANYGGQREPLTITPTLYADYIDGGTTLFRLSALEKVGLLDEVLFMYSEDLDMCLRLREAGYEVVVVSKARAWHRHTEIRQEDQDPRPYEVYYMYRNLTYLVRRRAPSSERRAYYARLLRQLPKFLGYFFICKKSPQLALVYVEALLHGLTGRMGKTRYV